MSKLEQTKQLTLRLLSHCDPFLVFAGVALAHGIGSKELLWQDVALFAAAITASVVSGFKPEPCSGAEDTQFREELARLRDEQSKFRTFMKMNMKGGEF